MFARSAARLALAAGLALPLTALLPAAASAQLAVRCGPHDCDYISCHDDGNHCVRLDTPDFITHPRWSREALLRAAWRQDDPGRDWRDGWRGEDGGWHYAAERWHHGLHRVCDPDGDRCYYSRARWWNYREYYRVHGYHWVDQRGWNGAWYDGHSDWRDSDDRGYGREGYYGAEYHRGYREGGFYGPDGRWHEGW